MILLVGLVILVAAVASFTRLLHEDMITLPWRDRMRARPRQPVWFRAVDTCFRCGAVWVSPLFTGPALALTAWGYGLGWTWWIILALLWIPVAKAVSYLAFLLYLKGEA